MNAKGQLRFYMKTHRNANGRVVAVCDSRLIGKAYEENGKVLDLKAHAGFYKGEPAGAKDVRKALKNFISLNLVGSEAVALAIGEKIIEKSQVREIAKVPHVQVYKI